MIVVVVVPYLYCVFNYIIIFLMLIFIFINSLYILFKINFKTRNNYVTDYLLQLQMNPLFLLPTQIKHNVISFL